MQTITEYLSKDHAYCDKLFEGVEQAVAAADWPIARVLFQKFESAYRRHLQFEEEVLFQRLDRDHHATPGPTTVMRHEHDQMRPLLVGMRDALEVADRREFYSLADLFRVLNLQHNQKEENILYPMADALLGSEVEELLPPDVESASRSACCGGCCG